MEKKASSFSGQIGFVLAAAGSAVGVGNLWRFPYLAAKDGGGLFLLVYLVLVLTFGFTLLTSDIAIGRRTKQSAIRAYEAMRPKWKFLGILTFLVPVLIMTYYAVIGGWITKYAAVYLTGQSAAAAEDGYFTSFITSPVSPVVFALLFMGVTAFIVYNGVEGGIERVSRYMMPILLVLVVVIAGYALTLRHEDASGQMRTGPEGLRYYLTPHMEGLTVSRFLQILLDAMSQLFFSLSVSMGIMITYGSYTGKEVNLVRSTAMVCVFDTVVALLAGLAIFPSVAHFDPSLLGSSKGVALMFIILPQVFESMGSVGQVVSFAFFVMVDIAAITSVVSLIEVVTQFVIQKFHVHRKRAALVVACVCFVVSIPIGISLGHVAILEESSPALFGLDWLTFFDEVTNTVLMPVCALFSCIVVGWFITPKRAVAEIEAEGTHMAGWLKKVYAVMIRFVTPALILIVEIGGLQSEIAAGNTAVIVFAYALVALCVVAYFAFFRNRDTGTNADEKLSGDYPV